MKIFQIFVRYRMIRIPPYHYIHVLDQTTNVTRLEVGPQTFVKKENEQISKNPEKMIIVPPRHFCVILNPILKDENGQAMYDNVGQVIAQSVLFLQSVVNRFVFNMQSMRYVYNSHLFHCTPARKFMSKLHNSQLFQPCQR